MPPFFLLRPALLSSGRFCRAVELFFPPARRWFLRRESVPSSLVFVVVFWVVVVVAVAPGVGVGASGAPPGPSFVVGPAAPSGRACCSFLPRIRANSSGECVCVLCDIVQFALKKSCDFWKKFTASVHEYFKRKKILEISI